jgi:hypothetical protein
MRWRARKRIRGIVALGDAAEYRVARDGTDPRGWGVVAANDEEIGRVADLIIDTDALTVRFLECRLHDERHSVLLPIGFVRFDADGERVLVDMLDARELRALAGTSGRPIDAEQEAALYAAFAGDERPPPAHQ